jgi:dihydrolipoamide dehydrogenase
METRDVAVVGAGPGGYVAAIRAAQLGLKVTLIEKDERLGGTCLNVGCIPSKALLSSSELYHAARHRAAEHGVRIDGLSLDLAAMMARKAAVVAALTDGVAGLMKKNKVKVVRGRAELAAADRLRVVGADGEEEIAARAIVLATGSAPVELPFLRFDGARVVDSTGALSLPAVPDHLVVIGAGAVGLELGSVWLRLGARVTVVEMMPQIAPFADKQVAGQLERALAGQGMAFHLATTVTAAEVGADQVVLSLRDGKGQEQLLAADRVLVAVGRRPYTEGLGLEKVGIDLDPRGRIPVDAALRTRVPSIYAIGDVVAGPMLAHKAEEEGVAVAETIAGRAGHANPDLVPSVVYTDPELATVGLTETAAKERGLELRVGRFLFRANGRAKAMGSEEGMVKVIADAATDRLLGVQIVGPAASELIAEAVVAMEFQASAEDLARTIHAHPTLSEAVKEAALAVDRRSIHS